MKRYGILVAIDRELIAFLNESGLSYEKVDSSDPFTVYRFSRNGAEFFVTKSGAGLVDAALGTQTLIKDFGVDVILNYGVVGALKDGIEVGDLLVAKKVVRHDIDFSFEGAPLGKYPDEKDIYFYPDAEMLKLCKGEDVKLATLASGDQFIDGKEKKIWIRDTFNADICDMEGGAIARTCSKYGKTFFMVKCISDTFSGGGVVEFDKYVHESGRKSFAFLLKLIDKIC